MATRTQRRALQSELEFKAWGGARRGSGRKPVGERSRVSHKTREPLASRFPVHVTVRLGDELPSLRNERTLRVLKRAFRAGSDRFGFRLAQFSVQGNHIHLLAEAKDRRALTRGMQGLLVRIAKALNKFWDRRGTVFPDRYHDRILRTPREVRRALAYVLHNARRHGRRIAGADFFSSAAWFDGWKERVDAVAREVAAPVVRARTWLLTVGWRRHGRIGVSETPGGARAG